MALTKVSGSVLKNPLSLSGNVSVGGTLTYEDVTNVDAVGVVTAREGIRVGAGKSIGSTNRARLVARGLIPRKSGAHKGKKIDLGRRGKS